MLITYYAHITDPPKPIDRTLKGNLPQFGKIAARVANVSGTVYTNTWAAWIYHGTLGYLQISRNDIIDFLTGFYSLYVFLYFS